MKIDFHDYYPSKYLAYTHNKKKSIFKTKEEVLIDSSIKCLHNLASAKNIHFEVAVGSINNQVNLLKKLAFNQKWAARKIFDALCETKVLVCSAPTNHYESVNSLITKLDETIIEIKYL